MILLTELIKGTCVSVMEGNDPWTLETVPFFDFPYPLIQELIQNY